MADNKEDSDTSGMTQTMTDIKILRGMCFNISALIISNLPLQGILRNRQAISDTPETQSVSVEVKSEIAEEIFDFAYILFQKAKTNNFLGWK